MSEVSAGPRIAPKPCRHDSRRRDGSLDDHCLLCGVDGYWHFGHRHDKPHPSGKVLLSLDCPDSAPETPTQQITEPFSVEGEKP